MSTENFQKILSAKDYSAIVLFLVIGMVLNHAGGHIWAPVMAITGIVGILGHKISLDKNTLPLLAPVALFFLWILLSTLWSPYEDNREFKNIYRFAIGIPLYGLTLYWMTCLSDKALKILRGMVMTLLPLSALIFAIECASGFMITQAVDPDASYGNMLGNISHGVSAVLVFSAPALLFLFSGNLTCKIIAAILIVSCAIISVTLTTTAAFIAFWGMIIVLGLSYFKPKLVFSLIISGFIALILFAPALGYFAQSLSVEQKAGIPFSWVWRLESWGYIHANIYDKFLFGHGFDSLRSIDETFDANGFSDLAIVPVHAHNIGLHIWYELGLVGVAFICAALFLAQRFVTKSDYSRSRIAALSGVSFVTIVYAALSYSPWSDWWLAVIALGFALALCVQPKTIKSRL